MSGWTGVVLALPTAAGDEMASRLPTHLHPIAGRALIWHSAAALAAIRPRAEGLVVLGDPDLSPDLFHDVQADVDVLSWRAGDGVPEEIAAADRVLVARGTTFAAPELLARLLRSDPGAWLGDADGEWVAARADGSGAASVVEAANSGAAGLVPSLRLDSGGVGLLVRDRARLALAARTVRERLVVQLMRAGVTFLAPETVLVDVDVRIGRDTVVYPGVVIEGATTIGEETVIGPGCRIIHSWVGSGVEMKGWNYVAHTSIRNRAILEPYVRRGFD